MLKSFVRLAHWLSGRAEALKDRFFPTLKPGAEGSPLPDGVEIYRLFRATNDGKCPPEAFELSTEDKAQPVPRLSAWATKLTTTAQADALTGRKKDAAGFLLVDDVRKLRPDPDNPDMRSLDVEWERAVELVAEKAVVVKKPGAKGHCGISRMNQETTLAGANLKNHRKSLRRKLASLVNERRVERIKR